jgi:hypothetical protein
LLISAFLYSYFLKKIVRIKARRNSKNIGKIKKNESKIYRISLAKKRRWGDSAENIYRGAVKKEEDLKQKIKEQKNILKKKIETARKDAYKTRKPEEIKKTEEMIKYIMEKYNLTEETLNEDD